MNATRGEGISMEVQGISDQFSETHPLYDDRFTPQVDTTTPRRHTPFIVIGLFPG